MECSPVSNYTSIHSAIIICKTLAIKVKGWLMEMRRKKKSYMHINKGDKDRVLIFIIQAARQNVVITGESVCVFKGVALNE